MSDETAHGNSRYDRPRSELTAEQKAELARRDGEMDANPEITLTWLQILASVEAER